jgi:hypothetical protein
MADTMTVASSVNWYLPPRTAQDYCREMRYFLHKSPDAWCQGVSARTGGGGPCTPTSPHARAWCMLGLIEHFVGDDGTRERVTDLLMRAISPDCWIPLHIYNDVPGRTVTEMIALLDTAAKLGDVPKPIGRAEYLAKTATHAKAVQATWWNKLATPDEATLAKFEADLDASLNKLTPWPTIMQQIERQAA